MGSHEDRTEAALTHAAAEELRRAPGEPSPLLLPGLVLRCDEAGVSAADVLRRALDRVACENGDRAAN